MLLLTTLSLSPNIQLSLRIGAPKHRNVMRRSKICSTQVRADEHYDACVAISIVDCFLLHQSAGALFRILSAPVNDLPVMAL